MTGPRLSSLMASDVSEQKRRQNDQRRRRDGEIHRALERAFPCRSAARAGP